LTPFNADGTLNEKGLRQLVRHNIDVMKVDGFYVGGSTGEAFLMSESQRIKAFEIVKDETGESVSLIAQIGSLDFDELIRLGQAAKSLGYDAVSAITPYYYKFSFEEVYNYYNKISEILDFEMVIYSNPGMAGGYFDLEKFEKLLSIPKVLGVKFSDADIAKFERLRHRFEDKLFYFGYDEIAMVGFALGCDGAIGSTYNIMGDLTRKVVEHTEAGKIETARELQHKIADQIEAIVKNGLYQTIKQILKESGVDGGAMKFPFSELDEVRIQEANRIKKEIDKLRIM
jgi:N-acetylneuraminate lyase